MTQIYMGHMEPSVYVYFFNVACDLWRPEYRRPIGRMPTDVNCWIFFLPSTLLNMSPYHLIDLGTPFIYL